jgi:uncharacterized protein (DUF58 family)
VKEIIKKLRKYEIKIRKAINTRMQGDFHSVFKGSGLEFADVRSYQYGDDVRTIDWNVSAKGHGTFVKTFREEKEQNVFFILDVSASQEIGDADKQKIDVGKEITAVLTLSAVKESGNVGFIGFSDQKELYIKPDKGQQHGYNMIYSMFKIKPKSIRTDVNKSLSFALNLLKRKSIVIIISDFIDYGYEQNLIAMAQKHDLVVIHLSDSREVEFPRLGIIPLYDKESRRTIWVNSSSKKFRGKMKNSFDESKKNLGLICRKYKANYLWIDTREEYVTKLIKLFRIRNQTRKSA